MGTSRCPLSEWVFSEDSNEGQVWLIYEAYTVFVIYLCCVWVCVCVCWWSGGENERERLKVWGTWMRRILSPSKRLSFFRVCPFQQKLVSVADVPSTSFNLWNHRKHFLSRCPDDITVDPSTAPLALDWKIKSLRSEWAKRAKKNSVESVFFLW